ncbi:MAG: TIGR00266 family protein [Spirochaetia bacterium]|nr:TIGR00266 family protein [Spirochaetia bacterium]
MKHTIKHNPSYALLDVELSPGESIQAEAGVMVYMSDDIHINSILGGGFLAAVLRKILGGESMFFNVFTAKEKPVNVGFAPDLAGDIFKLNVSDTPVVIQKGSYLCSETAVSLKTRFGGLKSFFSSEGVFLLEAGGSGSLYLSSYGGIVEVNVDGEYILDTGHMVAFEKTLDFTVSKTGGWKSTIFSGEGLTMRFKGHGKLWIQTRVPRGFISWLMRFLPS